MSNRHRDSTAVEFGLGLFRVVHVGTTISGGPPMNDENLALVLNHLRRISRASRRAERIEAARRTRYAGADDEE